MKSNTSRLLALNVFHLGMGQVASTLLGILLTAVLGRALGPTEFGILYSVFAIIAFVSVMMDWGQGTYLIREMARGSADERALIGSALLIRLITAIGGAVVSVLIAAAFGYGVQTVSLTLLAVVMALPTAMYAPLGFTFRGKDRMDIDAFAGVVGKAITLLATAIALNLGGGLASVFVMQGVGGLAALSVGAYFASQLNLGIGRPRKDLLIDLVSKGAPITAFSMVIASQPFVEVMMLGALAGASVVGWYGASRTIFGIVTSPSIITLAAFFPELSRAAMSLPDFRRMIDITSRVLFIVAAFAASALYVFADQLVATIYGAGRFEQTAAILRANAIFIPLLFFVLLLATAMTAVGRNKAMVVISIVRIAVCSILGWLFIGYWQQRFGNGAVILVVIAGIAEIPAVGACLFLLPKGSISRSTILNLVRACLVAICSVVPLLYLQPLPLYYLVPSFIFLFAVCSMATRLVLPSDVRLMFDVANNSIAAIFRNRAELKP